MIAEEFPQARLIHNSENLGFARAQNLGMLAARGKVLLVLNSDILFDGNPAKELYDFLMAGPEDLGVVGPQVKNPDNTIAPSARRARRSYRMILLSELNRHFYFKRFVPEQFIRKNLGKWFGTIHDNFNAHAEPREADFVDGMCAMFKRSVLERVGLFDEQFFFDSEIVDLSNRVRKAGYRIMFYPGARVIHLGGSSRRRVSRTMVWTTESHLRLYAKYAPQHVGRFRKDSIRIMRWKIAWLRLTATMRGANEQRDLIDMHRQMIDFSRDFNPDSVWKQQQIPRLKERRRSAEG